jgi:hypothetical protein
MRSLHLGIAMVAAIALPAQLAAQAPGAPAPKAGEQVKPPVAGANSFTEGQARDRIAKAGFENVKDLKQDRQGIWRGTAKKAGREVSVSLDYRGNVVQQ